MSDGSQKLMGEIPIGGLCGEALLPEESDAPVGTFVGEICIVGFTYTIHIHIEFPSAGKHARVRLYNCRRPGRGKR